jgi:hypothetical protein
VVEGKQSKRRTPISDHTWFQVVLLWQAGQYHSGQHITLGTGGAAIRMKTKVINMLEYGVNSNPLESNLQRMATIPRTLITDQLQYHK